jgi:hypothetical protein
VVLPPTPIAQTPNIIQATNTVIVALNTQGNAQVPSSLAPGTSNADSASSGGEKSVSKDKATAKDSLEAIKNELAPPKIYCN